MPDRRNVKSQIIQTTDHHERGKNFLSEKEIQLLLDAARKNRHGIRDHLLLIMMYRHGLRVSETITLKRADLDLQQARIWIRRLKNGLSVEHPFKVTSCGLSSAILKPAMMRCPGCFYLTRCSWYDFLYNL